MDKDTKIVMLRLQVQMMEHTASTLQMIVKGLEGQLQYAEDELRDLRSRIQELEWS